MIQIKKAFATTLYAILLFLTACTDKNANVDTSPDVRGTWNAIVTIDSCTPTDVCSASGFVTGVTVPAVMVLTQDRNQVEGTYAYTGVPFNSAVDGTAGGNQLVLDGGITNPAGSITLRLTGTVSGNLIDAMISHQITPIAGRAAAVTATGAFIR